MLTTNHENLDEVIDDLKTMDLKSNIYFKIIFADETRTAEPIYLIIIYKKSGWNNCAFIKWDKFDFKSRDTLFRLFRNKETRILIDDSKKIAKALGVYYLSIIEWRDFELLNKLSTNVDEEPTPTPNINSNKAVAKLLNAINQQQYKRMVAVAPDWEQLIEKNIHNQVIHDSVKELIIDYVWKRNVTKIAFEKEFDLMQQAYLSLALEELKAWKQLGDNPEADIDIWHAYNYEFKYKTLVCEIEKKGLRVHTDLLYQYNKVLSHSNSNEAKRIKKTYIDPIVKQTMLEWNKYYPSFKTLGTITGRLSSSSQRFPKETYNIDGHEINIRKIFSTDNAESYFFDFDQFELRAAAWLSEDPKMLEAFKNNKDLHQQTADELGVNRSVGKIINFGLLYGGGVNVLKRFNELKDYTEEELQTFVNKHKQLYPRLNQYIQECANKLKYERKLLIGDWYFMKISKNFKQYYKAFNWKVQGTCAWIMKVMGLEIQSKTFKAPVMQIHDEYWFDYGISIPAIQEIYKEKLPDIFKVTTYETLLSWADKQEI